ncbi:hypothetical protein [Ensifer sesbaniae]|uniref:hypothetical protein n=1 Tax=Ensifer sesbaniae TaxID=1214071 RepID=UPI001569188F|nr:hypothetical protein [Ensifer sesbaniae]NRQ17301.1 hypothetical protein [Ensifer sesbaniae]
MASAFGNPNDVTPFRQQAYFLPSRLVLMPGFCLANSLGHDPALAGIFGFSCLHATVAIAPANERMRA